MQYLLYTVGVFYIFQVFPKLVAIRFLAANTLIVFLAHMPLEYVIDSRLHELIPQTQLRVLCNQLIYFGLLAVVSSVLVRVTRVKQLKDWLAEKLFSGSAKPEIYDMERPSRANTQLRPSDLLATSVPFILNDGGHLKNMCGITGCVWGPSSPRLSAAQFEHMTDLLTHRGPDGRGVSSTRIAKTDPA